MPEPLTAKDVSREATYALPLAAGFIGLCNLAHLYRSRVASVKLPDVTETDVSDAKKKYDDAKAANDDNDDNDDVKTARDEWKTKKSHHDLVRISLIIKEGAKAFLKKEYSYLFGFVVIMGLVVGLVTKDPATIIAFVFGAVISASCGWVGMTIATEANAKTTFKAESPKNGLNEALRVAFASGSVMGFGVVSFGLMGLSVLYAIFGGETQEETRYLAGFGFGASAIALFARVGGGIYTKAADVGADLVGKVEAGMEEDDPRNPATIADNVGDNVGDVAGMGADLFESFVGSIIAAVQLSGSYVSKHYPGDNQTMDDEERQDIRGLISFPFFIAAFGLIMSCIGIYFIKTTKQADFIDKTEEEQKHAKNELQEALLWTIRFGIFFTSGLSTVCTLVITIVLFGTGTNMWVKMWACTAIGLVAGVLIGIWTEYATAYTYKPTQTIAKKGNMGPAPVVIQGIGIGMLSTMGPTLIIFISILACYKLGETYGIAIAAVGMLSTLGVTLATDAFGPVADNAGGLAEMCEFPANVRETTDGLDALGNTTAATGKGFAIGSAVLSALALLSAYKADANITIIDVSKSEVLAGAVWGSCLPFIFAAMTMMAVGRAATMMIDEVRKQIVQFNLLEEDWKTPDYNKCIDISTKASVVEMVIPGVLAVVSPLFIGYLLGPEALGGMLVGGITCGFMLAVFMANAGGAWDNAKKYVEAGQVTNNKGVVQKKKTACHAAVVAGDTIGDPFKDTSGPALNILMKLMTMVSLVFAPQEFRDRAAYEPMGVLIAVIIAVLFMILAVSLTLWMRSMGFGKLSFDNEQQTTGGSAERDPLKA